MAGWGVTTDARGSPVSASSARSAVRAEPPFCSATSGSAATSVRPRGSPAPDEPGGSTAHTSCSPSCSAGRVPGSGSCTTASSVRPRARSETSRASSRASCTRTSTPGWAARKRPTAAARGSAATDAWATTSRVPVRSATTSATARRAASSSRTNR
ncbi:MAG: hypothetical protein PGN11_06735 [Quadrisphaera sp.]